MSINQPTELPQKSPNSIDTASITENLDTNTIIIQLNTLKHGALVARLKENGHSEHFQNNSDIQNKILMTIFYYKPKVARNGDREGRMTDIVEDHEDELYTWLAQQKWLTEDRLLHFVRTIIANNSINTIAYIVPKVRDLNLMRIMNKRATS